MRINLGTKVVTSDGNEIGKIDRLVVDPRTDEMREFVVHKGFFLQHDIIIPIGAVRDQIGNDDEDAIHLMLSSEDVARMPEFVEAAYVAPPDEFYPGAFGTVTADGGLLWPASVYEPATTTGYATTNTSTTTNVAPGAMTDTLAEARPNSVFLTTGTDVVGRDGKIGTVDELVVDLKRGKVTELIVRKGLFNGKEIRIPTQFIEEIDDAVVHVALSKDRLERFTVKQ